MVARSMHETYYDPVRESRDRASGFAEDLTSYGDFTVQAKIRTRDGVETVATPLSRALTSGHAPNLTPPIASALLHFRHRRNHAPVHVPPVIHRHHPQLLQPRFAFTVFSIGIPVTRYSGSFSCFRLSPIESIVWSRIFPARSICTTLSRIPPR